MDFPTREDFLTHANADKKDLLHYDVRDDGFHWNVFHDRQAKTSVPCVVRAFEVRHSIDRSKEPHNVLIAHFVDPDGTARFAGWCGDNFYEKKMDLAEANTRIDAAVRAAQDQFPSADHSALRQLLHGHFGSAHSASGGCNFWRARTTSGGCKHYKLVLQRLVDEALLDDLEVQYNDVLGAGSLLPKPTQTINASALEMQRCAFMHPVLLFGPKGTGKSHAAREYGQSDGVTYIEYGVHEGTEGFDLLGQTIPFNGKWVWRDGPMTEAFRKGARGEKIVLCLDELLRMRVTHRSALLSAFSEYRGHYTLRTGRILSEQDGVGQEETIQCPVANLFLVGTTNVGDQYSLDELDDALRSRFKLVYMPDNEDVLRNALAETLALKADWKEAEKDTVSKALTDAVSKSLAGVKSGALRSSIDLRAVKRVIASASTPGEVRGRLASEYMQCVGLDSQGRPIPEHEAFFGKLVAKVFGATTKTP